MPYKLQQVDGGWEVVSEDTGKKHSNHPLSEGRAKAQMRALYANVKDSKAPKKQFKGRHKRK